MRAACTAATPVATATARRIGRRWVGTFSRRNRLTGGRKRTGRAGLAAVLRRTALPATGRTTLRPTERLVVLLVGRDARLVRLATREGERLARRLGAEARLTDRLVVLRRTLDLGAGARRTERRELERDLDRDELLRLGRRDRLDERDRDTLLTDRLTPRLTGITSSPW